LYDVRQVQATRVSGASPVPVALRWSDAEIAALAA
jgi:hypothetical protein